MLVVFSALVEIFIIAAFSPYPLEVVFVCALIGCVIFFTVILFAAVIIQTL